MSNIREMPQRLRRPAAPGELTKRLIGVATLVRLREALERDPIFLSLVRQCPCIRCGMDPCGEAAHIRITSAAFNKKGGMSKKPADRWAISLCAGCHREERDALHRTGEYLFWQQLGINPLLVCEKLYKQRSDIVAMRAVIFEAMANRGADVGVQKY